MRIGCCLAPNTFMPEFKNDVKQEELYKLLINGYQNIMKMGFDYVESTAGAVNDLTDDERALLAQNIENGACKIDYINCFLPGSIRMCVDCDEARKHADKTYKNLHTLGIKALVFGSGKARSYPEDMSEADGNARFREFLRYCAETGAKYGIFTCLEPLQATETNQINYVSQALEWVKEINHPYLKITPDAFHMAVGNENPSVLKEALPYIHHIHVSDAPGRVYPGKNGGEYLVQVGKVLREIGYDGDLTIECGYSDFVSDMTAGLTFLKENVV